MKYFISLLFAIYTALAFSQTNKWIDYNSDHLEITISEDGLYVFSKNELIQAGFSGFELETQQPHVFRHGKEIPLNWDGNTLSFFAHKNKGEQDSLLYRPFSARPTENYSLFQDEAIYYLRWSNEPITLWNSKVSPSVSSLTPNIIYKKKVIEYYEQYSFNNSIGLLPNVQQSYFEEGEGWTGKFLSMDSAATFRYPLEDMVLSTENSIHLTFQLNGRSRLSHQVLYEINGIRQTDTLRFTAFGILKNSISFSSSTMASKELLIKFIGIKADQFDWFSLSKVQIEYPIADKIISEEFYSKTTKALQFTCQNCVLVQNPNSVSALQILPLNNGYTLEKGQTYQFFKTDLKPKNLTLRRFKIVAKDANYFIITHNSLLTSANEYAAYRQSAAGGSYRVAIVAMEDLYQQFSYGERTPLAIKNYIDWACSGTYAGKHLFLLGRGVSFPDVLKTWRDRDLVPTFGYPGSDVLLSAGLDKSYDSDVQSIATGRLNVTKNSEILAYLDKVKEIENAPIASEWKKNFAHLSGGKSIFEISALSQTLANISPFASEGLLGADVEAFIKKSTAEVEQIDISEQVNEGLGMIAFAGHGSANVIDLNIGYCSPPENGFNNKGKYPIMYFNGCGVGNVFYRYDPLTTDWLLTPDKGAIAVFANSFWSYQLSTEIFLNAFYRKLFLDESSVNLTLGELHKEVNQSLKSLKFNQLVLTNIHQLILQGDPAIKYFPIEKPDYKIDDGSIFISSQDLSRPIGENEELNIGVLVKNLGRYDKSKVAKAAFTIITDLETKLYEIEFDGFARNDTIILTIPKAQIQKIAVLLKGVEEYESSNNYGELTVTNWEEVKSRTSFPANVLKDKLGPLVYVLVDDKILDNDVFISRKAKKRLVLIDENPISLNKDKMLLELKKCNTCEFEVLNTENIQSDSPYQLSFDADLLLSEGSYSLRFTGYDEVGNPSQAFLRNFKVSAEQKDTELSIFPNPSRILSVLAIDILAPENPTSSKVNLYDGRGQLIREIDWKITVGKNEKEINISNLPIGIYYVKAIITWQNGKEELVKKLIVTN